MSCNVVLVIYCLRLVSLVYVWFMVCCCVHVLLIQVYVCVCVFTDVLLFWWPRVGCTQVRVTCYL